MNTFCDNVYDNADNIQTEFFVFNVFIIDMVQLSIVFKLHFKFHTSTHNLSEQRAITLDLYDKHRSTTERSTCHKF